MALVRVFALALALVVTVQGCASIQYAIEATPRRTVEAFSDPVRRQHLISEVSLQLSAGSVTIGCLLLLPVVGVFVCPVAGLAYYFITYEYVLEPLSKELVKKGKPSLVGPYFERGPQDGEVYVNP